MTRTVGRRSRLGYRNPADSGGAGITMRRPEPVGIGDDDPAEQRALRRSGDPVVLTGAFRLDDEIRALLAPLSDRVAKRRRVNRIAVAVADVRDALDGLTAVAAKLTADAEAQRRTAHLPDAEAATARRALRSLHARPAVPEIDAGDLADGGWVDRLVGVAEPLSGPLSDLLARAKPPGTTRSTPSISEQVMAVLRDFDVAVDALDRALDTDPDVTASPTGPPNLAALAKQRKADEARATLRALGLDPDATP